MWGLIRFNVEDENDDYRRVAKEILSEMVVQKRERKDKKPPIKYGVRLNEDGTYTPVETRDPYTSGFGMYARTVMGYEKPLGANYQNKAEALEVARQKKIKDETPPYKPVYEYIN